MFSRIRPLRKSIAELTHSRFTASGARGSDVQGRGAGEALHHQQGRVASSIITIIMIIIIMIIISSTISIGLLICITIITIIMIIDINIIIIIIIIVIIIIIAII